VIDIAKLREFIREVLREELSLARAPEQLVTVAAYAAARSLHENTVRAAIADGRLPCVRAGRAVRVPSDAEIQRRPGKDPKMSPRERALRVLGGGK
jgi:hypothetical protein